MVPRIKGIVQDPNFMEYYDTSGVKITKFNKTTYALTGNFVIKQRLDHLKFSVSMAKKMGNGYIPMPVIEKSDYCGTLKTPAIKQQFEDLFAHTTMPFGCEHEPGDYKILDYVPKMQPGFPPGEYRGEFTFYHDHETLGIIRFFIVSN
ncbi:uncharacterized protein LOC123292517 [Chrysoperla carnea]|uniref:uncharacterized protein LOC123292517 n=1 Tax=Chrysoperla carnea TaxID=189513 RepID=UPI001D05D36A|nr:uncharacterized protein LOC123292517 [Chrysoperla carnea]